MAIKVGITSLGCAKNLVDSEVMLGYLRDGGFDICDELGDADVVVVNTCSFITEAEREAAQTIRQLLDLKKRGAIARVLVAGCLPARRGEKLSARFPGVDRFVAAAEIPRLASIVRELTEPAAPGVRVPGEKGWFLYDHQSPRIRLTPPHYAYVKIGEGCSNRCSYCLIPSIKGPLRSREMESVIQEARALAAEGVREINLISQDTTAYGTDLYGKVRIVELIRQLARLDGIRWIRMLYGHPAHYSGELFEYIAREPKVCSYVDFPLQHIADPMLSAMNRHMTKKQAVEKLRDVRRLAPGAAVRTTFIVGYPGEGEGEFSELLDFVAQARFEHLGAFIYSREKGTPAAEAPGQIPQAVKRERFHRLMALQQGVVREMNQRMIGGTVEVMVDGKCEDGAFPLRGRCEGDAPEVDGTVYIRGEGLAPGDFTDVRITGTREYDLMGEAVPPALDIF